MYGSGGNIASFSHSISARLAALRQSHLALENDMRRLRCVFVIGVKRVRAILPDVRVKKTFLEQLPFQRFLIGDHSMRTWNKPLRLLFLRTEYPGGNSRNSSPRNKPYGFRAQPIRETRNHRTFPRRERRKTHVSDLLRRLRSAARVVALPGNLKKFRGRRTRA